MLRKLLLLLAICTVNLCAYSQKIMMPTTPVTDSVKTQRLSKNKVQDVDGIRMGTAKDIVENLRESPRFTVLTKALRAAGLIGTFKSKGPLTLFAPTDAAFKKMKKGRLDTLMKKAHILELSSFLTCHAIPGKVSTKDLKKQIRSGNGKAELITIGGCKIIATTDVNGNIMLTDETGGKSMITTPDLSQSNGYIHVVNAVLTPKLKAI